MNEIQVNKSKSIEAFLLRLSVGLFFILTAFFSSTDRGGVALLIFIVFLIGAAYFVVSKKLTDINFLFEDTKIQKFKWLFIVIVMVFYNFLGNFFGTISNLDKWNSDPYNPVGKVTFYLDSGYSSLFTFIEFEGKNYFTTRNRLEVVLKINPKKGDNFIDVRYHFLFFSVKKQVKITCRNDGISVNFAC